MLAALAIVVQKQQKHDGAEAVGHARGLAIGRNHDGAHHGLRHVRPRHALCIISDMNRPAADCAALGSVRFLVKLLQLPVRKSTPVATRQGKPI